MTSSQDLESSVKGLLGICTWLYVPKKSLSQLASLNSCFSQNLSWQLIIQLWSHLSLHFYWNEPFGSNTEFPKSEWGLAFNSKCLKTMRFKLLKHFRNINQSAAFLVSDKPSNSCICYSDWISWIRSFTSHLHSPFHCLYFSFWTCAYLPLVYIKSTLLHCISTESWHWM